MEARFIVCRIDGDLGWTGSTGGGDPTPERGDRAKAIPCLDWRVIRCSQGRALSVVMVLRDVGRKISTTNPHAEEENALYA